MGDVIVDAMRLARRLTKALLLVMTTQALTGLLFRNAYRDVEWIRATWLGNDWVTLVVVIPLLVFGVVRAGGQSVRRLLLWLGLLWYALYNYAFYLFGAALNAFFPIYVAAVVLAATVLILVLSQIDPRQVAQRFRPAAPARLIGGSLLFVGLGLSSAWIGMWGAHVFAGWATPVESEAFKLLAALDLLLIVPTLTLGGALIWKHRPWGVVIAAIGSIQGSLYLFVLSTNAVVLIKRGVASSPGELPIWGLLTILMTLVAISLLTNIRSNECSMNSGTAHSRLWTVLRWIGVFAVTLTGTAFAQDRPRPAIEIGAGWIAFPDDGLVSEAAVNGAARWYLLPRVSFGPEIVYIMGERHSHLVLTGNMTFDLRSATDSRGYVMPFVVVGGGVFQTRETFGFSDFTANEGAFTAGGGVRTSASDRVMAGIDVRIGWETHVRINGFLGLRLGR